MSLVKRHRPSSTSSCREPSAPAASGSTPRKILPQPPAEDLQKDDQGRDPRKGEREGHRDDADLQ